MQLWRREPPSLALIQIPEGASIFEAYEHLENRFRQSAVVRGLSCVSANSRVSQEVSRCSRNTVRARDW